MNTDRLSMIFDRSGTLAKVLAPDYEWRPQQQEMARAVARTLEGMAWLNISRNMQGGTWQDAWVLLGPDSRS